MQFQTGQACPGLPVRVLFTATLLHNINFTTLDVLFIPPAQV
jgi:hypothetical protein